MNVQSDFQSRLQAGTFNELFVREFLVKPGITPLVRGSVTQAVQEQVTAGVTAAINANPQTANLPAAQKQALITQQVQQQMTSQAILNTIASETQKALQTATIDVAGKAINQTASLTENTLGVFASTDYQISERLKLTAGIRFNQENKDITFRQNGIAFDIKLGGQVVAPNQVLFAGMPNANPQQVAQGDLTSTFSQGVVTANAALNYRFNTALNGYVSYARGYRSGGFGIRYTQIPKEITEPFKAETVNNLEVGLKASNKANTLFGNLAIFNMDYRNMQIPIILPNGQGQLTTNAGVAAIRGFELDFAAYLTKNFALSGGFGYNDAQYTDYKYEIPASGTTPARTVDQSGNRISTIPTANLTAAADYFVPVGKAYRLALRLQYSYRANIEAPQAAVAAGQGSAYELGALSVLNGRIALESKKLSVYAFGRNLANYSYFTTAYSASLFATPINFQVNAIGEPRFLGIGATYTIGKK